jgi:hypothetical protein
MMLNPIFESSSPSDFWGKRCERYDSFLHSRDYKWHLMYHRIYAPIRIIFTTTPLDGISLCMEYLKEVSTSLFEHGTPDLLHRWQPFWPAVFSTSGYYRVRILHALLNCMRSFPSLTH